MSWITRIFFRSDLYGNLAEEMRAHIEEKTEQFMREGMSRDEAVHAARRAFGNTTLIEQRGREAWQWPRLESLVADAKFALRQLRRSPGFAVTAVLTLALGIGANAAIFTLIDSIMLRPLPYPHQERLVRISGTDEQGRPSSADFPKGWIRAWQKHSQSFESISGYAANTESNVTGNDQSERVFGSAVTVNTFDTLGIHPAIGSFFSPENAVGGQDMVVVLSYGYWRQRFAGNPGVIGETVRIEMLDAESQKAGVEVRRYKAKDEKSAQYYSEVPFDMELDGPYYSMLNFFDRVSKLERIVNVSGLLVSTTKKPTEAKVKHQYQYAPNESVAASFTATTFYSHDLTPAAAAPGAKPGTAAVAGK